MNWTSDHFSAFIFDLDGCIYSGNTLYKGSFELLTYLTEEKKEIYFLSNNSTNQAETIRRKLMKMGLPVEHATILVATDLIGEYLYENYGSLKIKAAGTKELKESLKIRGHTIYPLNHEEPCDFIVVGRDTSFTYHTLTECVRSVAQGARLIATNLDVYHPGEDGNRVPETGSLLAAIKAVLEIEDVPFIGKPFAYSFHKIIKHKGYELDRCLMIGDNPYTDVIGAGEAGIRTVWISHGHTFPDDLDFQPDVTFQSMEGLAESFINHEYSRKIIG